ncbi:MAG: dephospho-CoA kinase, partial [Flavobacteriales bacterium]
NSDSIAKTLMEQNSELRQALTNRLGDGLYTHNQLNREWLANILFSDEESRKFVESIVHRAVHREFQEWKSQQSSEIIIRESAPLVSIDLTRQADTIVLVACPHELRLKRVLQRAGMNQEKFEERSRLQHTEETIRPHAHYEIINDGRAIVPQVMALLGK